MRQESEGPTGSGSAQRRGVVQFEWPEGGGPGTECEQGKRNMGETELSWIKEVYAYRDMSYSKHMSWLSKVRERERDKLDSQADGPAKRQKNKHARQRGGINVTPDCFKLLLYRKECEATEPIFRPASMISSSKIHFYPDPIYIPSPYGAHI